MREVIRSADNANVKFAAKLAKSTRGEDAFILEGLRLAEAAVEAKAPLRYALVTEGFGASERQEALAHALEEHTAVYEVPERLYQKASATKSPQGVLLVAEKEPVRLDGLEREAAPLVVVLDAVQDPGNVGTIIRTADAAGAAAVLLTRGSADPYGDKAVRATMGSLFHLPVAADLTAGDVLRLAEQTGARLLAAALTPGAECHYEARYDGAIFLILGSEARGIGPELLAASEHVLIPMKKRPGGSAESLNVAASAAILLYEALRQREYAK